MSDLVEFLRARLDEDEDEARFVAQFNRTAEWRYSDGVEEARRETVRRHGPGTTIKTCSHERVYGPRTCIKFAGDYPALTREMKFIARHDPARVLREVKAKRRIIELAGAISCSGAEFAEQDYQTLTRSLAAVYSDHPDYQADWAP